MQFPFTAEQFFEVFGNYNNFAWIFTILFYSISLVSLYLIYHKSKSSNKIASGFLAILWLWMGIVYHIIFFSGINKAAYAFGIIFIIQGILFLIFGLKEKLVFEFKKNIYTAVGLFFIIFGLIIYPLIGIFSGHSYPQMPIFGLPCPSTIFTFGLLLLTQKRFSKTLLIIPVLWAGIGSFAALSLNVPQDYMLSISAVISVVLIYYRDKILKQS